MYAQFQAEYQPSSPVLSMFPENGHQPRQSHGTASLIGRPILFESGQFAGQAIRAELHEIQQADLGRKYARVDRRPLDPPPVVQLRLFKVFNVGSTQETEDEFLDYDEIQTLGPLCTVDLFPVPIQANVKDLSDRQAPHTPPAHPPFPSAGPSHISHPAEQAHTIFTFVPNEYPTKQPSVEFLPLPSHCIPAFLPPPPSGAGIVRDVDDFPIIERSKMTHALVGATFAQSAIVEYQGKKSIMFVFADLAVKVEGNFILRYRVFDLFSKPYNQTGFAIQAECYGGSFRIYSTKEFPGLQASTELTKQLARWGVRLNTRETERKRRPGKKAQARSISPLYTGIGKRKYTSPRKAENGGDD